MWESTAALVPGVGLRANGSVTVATGPGELALMEEVAARPDAGARQLTVLDAAQVRTVTRRCGEKCSVVFCAGRDAGGGNPAAVLGALRGHLRRQWPLPLAPWGGGREVARDMSSTSRCQTRGDARVLVSR